ncbi:hypothetical protein [Polynucleobacter paneuropaeus]|uniref:hypothetical protein n=1 Tax=Polynucleobacter paneuropaeus TaxID=2527775 RepID=UPI001BFDE94E|nr:hypothetical protein [Polynucleobacter paneuropaeus]MBT8527746.1 hypothetical protein [Polynucleobacter paneuropaeus]MBT8534359.1 hypothetical protein [Polynucleobacter paneuropaeus]MBT8635472.1 hypothetical protein [Polynucleobacter paneuropaeus]QWD53748.1 hypothetical protein C2752_06425 [Polynucleobacter paneuropaeus]QWD55450.1 hypothetical protein C2750_06880 [Polynucleobacter paneuropaeus]
MKKLTTFLLVLLMFLAGCQSTSKDGEPLTPAQITQMREARLKMAQTGLDSLIKQDPKVKAMVSKSAGYAVFSTTNINVVLIVVARGQGVLFDKRRKEPVFMNALKTGEGVGAGYQDQYQIAFFKTPGSIDEFLLTSIDGQKDGIDIAANFSAGSGGTIRSFNPDITFYTVGLSGYDLQANYGGTLYLVDQQLNDASTLASLPKKSQQSSKSKE